MLELLYIYDQSPKKRHTLMIMNNFIDSVKYRCGGRYHPMVF